MRAALDRWRTGRGRSGRVEEDDVDGDVVAVSPALGGGDGKQTRDTLLISTSERIADEMGGEIVVLELERPERLGTLGQRMLLDTASSRCSSDDAARTGVCTTACPATAWTALAPAATDDVAAAPALDGRECCLSMGWKV